MSLFYNTECYIHRSPTVQKVLMRVFKNKPFARFARKAGLADKALLKAITDAEQGLVDADLGGGVLKQRVARDGGGKSGGFRTIILFRLGERAFFVLGFAKSDRDNIRDDELAAFKLLAAALLAYDDVALATAVAAGVLLEVMGDDETIS
jgi:hypothetical protein